MIQEIEVLVNVTHRNKTYYRNKEYICENGDSILVKINDLNPNGITMVHAECQGCKVIFPMEYRTYLININSTEINEYYCNKCNHIKKGKINSIKQSEGKLTRKDRGYWTFKENRTNELYDYIVKHDNNLNNMIKFDPHLFNAIYEYDKGIPNLLRELNLNPEEYLPEKMSNWNNSQESISNKIKSFINENKRFPSQQEMGGVLRISSREFQKYFKNFEECKKYIGYYNKDDLIDNRGDLNRSHYELFVANYLIAQGLGDYYKREESPFKKYDTSLNYRSDFTFYLKDKEIHIEVWASSYDNKFLGIYRDYLNKRKIKEDLYKKNKDDIILIGIEPKTFACSYKQIERNLYEIFKNYLELNYSNIDYELLLTPNNLTEDEVLNLLIKYSSNANKIPSNQEVLKHKGGYALLNYINKRFGGLTYFAVKYGKDIGHKNQYWNDNTVFKSFDYMLEKYNQFLSKTEYKKIDDCRLQGLYAYIDKTYSLIDYKIKYINNLIDNHLILSEYLYKTLCDIANNSIKNFYNLKLETQEKAQRVLENYKHLKYEEEYDFGELRSAYILKKEIDSLVAK